MRSSIGARIIPRPKQVYNSDTAQILGEIEACMPVFEMALKILNLGRSYL